MFTGIIEERGRVEHTAPGVGGGRRLVISAGFAAGGVAVGDSIAISGVCLTAADTDGVRFSIDAGPETLARTTIGKLVSGSGVNLERALTLSSRLGGHLVQGHVDGVAHIKRIQNRENARDFWFDVPEDLRRFIALRGSIAIDGISLTVTSLNQSEVSVSIIPHTLRVTTIGEKRENDPVNVEVDLLARYLDQLLSGRASTSPPASGVTEDFLKTHGF